MNPLLRYTVYSSDHNTHGMTGFSFTICTQANKFTAVEVPGDPGQGYWDNSEEFNPK